MSASAADGLRKVSTATTVVAPATPSLAVMLSGKSVNGSAPTKNSTSIWPPAAAARIHAASRPPSFGISPHRSVTASAASARRVRPGSRPGARPMSSAPRTFPRRAATKNVAWGACDLTTEATSATAWDDSATDERPSTTTTDPDASSSASGSSPSSSSRSVDAASPPRQRSLRAACGLRPVATGDTSTKRVVPARAAPRRRRCSTGSSSRRSPHTSSVVSAVQASSMVAAGRPSASSGGTPSPS